MSYKITRTVLRTNHPALWKYPHLVLLLLGMAEHAQHDGTAFPSVRTLAYYIKRDERTAKRQIQQLKKLGLIVEGDQKKASRYGHAGHRPVVYNINLRELCKYPPPERGDTRVTSPASGVTPVTTWGDTGVQSGVTPVSPKPSVEPSKNQASRLQDRRHADPQYTDHGPEITDPEPANAEAVLTSAKTSGAQHVQSPPAIDTHESKRTAQEEWELRRHKIAVAGMADLFADLVAEPECGEPVRVDGIPDVVGLDQGDEEDGDGDMAVQPRTARVEAA